MGISEALRASLASLRAHRLRSALTVLGIVFGVGAVIAMLSIGAGAEREAMETIRRLGVDNVVVRSKKLPDDELSEIRARSLGLSLRDCQAISDAVPGVKLVAPKVEIDPWAVLAASGSVEAEVFGVSDHHRRLAGLSVARGRFIDAADLRYHAQVAVIGDEVARALYGFAPALGEHLKVNDVWFQVIGVLAPTGSDADVFEGVTLGSPSTAVYIPYTTALRKLEHDPLASPLSEAFIRLDTGSSGRQVAAVTDRLLRVLHGGADDYEMVVPEALLEQSRQTQRMFNIVMGCIAGISLLVGGIGIMNIMLATVLERTREIGLRRAVGARRRDVMFQFLVESFALSAIGGLAGVVMGIVISWAVATSAGWTTQVTPGSVVLATSVALVVGLVSGLYPARRAALLDPIEALRYE